MKEEKIIFEKRSGDDLISPETIRIMMSTARWARFLAIVSFVLIAIAVVSIITAGITMTSINYNSENMHGYMYSTGGFSWGRTIVMLIYLLVYFIPTWHLFSYSNRIRKAFTTGEATLREASSSLLRYYTFIGILVAISIIMMIAGTIMMFMMRY